LKSLKCANCGNTDLVQAEGYGVCEFCDSRFVLNANDVPQSETSIEINSDVELLLKKCTEEPKKSSFYANLILDIDPHNVEAQKYL
jgi:hypothetical protein